MPEEQKQSLREFQWAIVLPRGARDRLELSLKEGIYALRTWLQMGRHPSIQKEREVNFAFPATWWQSFKHQYFPGWLKQKFPVRMEVVSKKVEWQEGPILLCPHTSTEPTAAHEKFLVGADEEQAATNAETVPR